MQVRKALAFVYQSLLVYAKPPMYAHCCVLSQKAFWQNASALAFCIKHKKPHSVCKIIYICITPTPCVCEDPICMHIIVVLSEKMCYYKVQVHLQFRKKKVSALAFSKNKMQVHVHLWKITLISRVLCIFSCKNTTIGVDSSSRTMVYFNLLLKLLKWLRSGTKFIYALNLGTKFIGFFFLNVFSAKTPFAKRNTVDRDFTLKHFSVLD